MSEFLLHSPDADTDAALRRPGVAVAVVMCRERIDNRWQAWRWQLADVVPHEDGFGTQARLLYKGDHEERWLHPGFMVELFSDDGEGYYLNVTTEAPCWFVRWHLEEEATIADDPIAKPGGVTLSYHEAGRWMDAQDTIEQVPVPPQVIEWMRAFTDANYVPEPKRRKRPESFKPLTDRMGRPAVVTTLKKFGGDHG